MALEAIVWEKLYSNAPDFVLFVIQTTFSETAFEIESIVKR